MDGTVTVGTLPAMIHDRYVIFPAGNNAHLVVCEASSTRIYGHGGGGVVHAAQVGDWMPRFGKSLVCQYVDSNAITRQHSLS
jgi:hypothetical protein